MDIRVTQSENIPSVQGLAEKPKEVSEDFSFALKKAGEDGLTERLNGLMSEIAVQGKRLAEHMDIKDMRKYRSLISDFMNEVVNNSHKFERENFLDRRGRHRVYGIVKLVNKEIDELAQELIKSEKDHLKILARTDEIHGLLLNMIV